MILYVLCFITLCVMLCFVYMRLKYKFWSLQPVFHFYDLNYWFVNVGIINKNLPEKNRYVNLKKIKTLMFDEIDEITKNKIVTLIRLNYYINNENKYDPKKENIMPYFIGHNSKTYWSYFIDKELLIDNKNGRTIEENKIIGVITSRPLNVKINKTNINFDVYYVDYLCVNKYWRKKNIAPQLIQTHEYNQSYNNRKISVSLFKREEELTGIIPLTIYKTYCFPLNKINLCCNDNLSSNDVLLNCDKQNIYYLYNFINEITDFDITIYPTISNLIELIDTKNIIIKMIISNGVFVSAYFFRKTCTYIEKDKEIISCIASINTSKLSNDEFIRGFKLSLLSIINKYNNYHYLSIEDISDNLYIINDICINTHPMIISPMAYFFYNFAYAPFKSNKCFIIN